MNLQNCYIVVYNDDEVILARQFMSFESKFNKDKSFWGVKASKAGINLPKNAKYFSLMYLPSNTSSKNLLSKGKILLAEEFPPLNTLKRYYIKELNKPFNINVKNKFFTVTISNASKKAFNS
jgi:hypothetical protein